jgi:hypothetical protein
VFAKHHLVRLGLANSCFKRAKLVIDHLPNHLIVLHFRNLISLSRLRQGLKTEGRPMQKKIDYNNDAQYIGKQQIQEYELAVYKL